MGRKVTSLDAIRQQAAPEVIEVPGFRPGTTICVSVKPVDISSALMEANLPNPLLEAAAEQARKAGANLEEIEERVGEIAGAAGLEGFQSMRPLIDLVVKRALVEPTWEQIEQIEPLHVEQKLAIFEHVTGGLDRVKSFRGKRRLP